MNKALLIDVKNKTVIETCVSSTQDIYKLIGNGCDLFCCPYNFPNGDALYTDDEGLLKENIVGCFMFPEWNIPIVGNAIILGETKLGDMDDCKSTVEEILSKIKFYPKEEAEAWVIKVMSQPHYIYFL